MAIGVVGLASFALLLPPVGHCPGRPTAASGTLAALPAAALPVRMGLFDWLPGNQKEPTPPGFAQAKHILFLYEPSAEEKANQLIGRIRSGEISFSEAARAFSCCPSRDLNGDLGTFSSLGAAGSLPLIGELPYQGKDTRQFDEAVFSAELNVPVKAYSQWGVHLLLVEERGPQAEGRAPTTDAEAPPPVGPEGPETRPTAGEGAAW
mmetsp:Transcript_23521/g.47827  ORF Transcript_23521/g.47827 Transcript_23521/m.47827 type:complete len:207 (+) Transcript_23521:18-638(+)|eukprot:CAMPEP_0119072192 /NCGR_PEP_ID=MMETSP1178-20130426/58206_1 /TAXON_ID=33656 /ORGANISM="unid sp, Strain CCMP2000" /LENGTH=206 /DNA_ID=CAMNT_0007054179 /DNA_START=18 /DNA_END=638 /DNA_ORIENTATION=+